MAILVYGCVWLLLAIITTVAQRIPDPQALTISELEARYFDTQNQGFFSGVTPCTTYIDSSTALPNNSLGRQTAAQWIRTAFHDFVTADVAAGIGGIDASIGYETLNPENVRPAFNDSLFFFSIFFNDRLSMADLIALGTVAAVGACGGPHIPLRGGRIDATSAGASGVCEPETDLKTVLSDFAGAGFNQQDAIGLTACGHSMGGVHHAAFPNVVPASAVSANNLDGRSSFDESFTVFDDQVVQDYLSGTGSRGGPLVTTANKTVQSDLRLYTSDGNKTMKSLGKSKDYFASTCTDLLARMLDTVPKGVSLTPVIKPSDVKPVNFSVGLDWNGTMSLSGSIRYMDTAASAPAPANLPISLKGRNGRTSVSSFKATTNLAADTGTGIFGPQHSYPFTISFPASTGLSGLTVKDRSFPLQDSIFVVNPLSSVSPGRSGFGNSQFAPISFTINITVAALLPKAAPSLKATFAFPRPRPGTMNPQMDYSNTLSLAPIGRVEPYALYSGVLKTDQSILQLFSSSVDVEAEGSATKVMFFKTFDLVK